MNPTSPLCKGEIVLIMFFVKRNQLSKSRVRIESIRCRGVSAAAIMLSWFFLSFWSSKKIKRKIGSSFIFLKLYLPKSLFFKTFFYPLFEGKKWQKPLMFYKEIPSSLSFRRTAVNSCYSSKSFLINKFFGSNSRYFWIKLKI